MKKKNKVNHFLETTNGRNKIFKFIDFIIRSARSTLASNIARLMPKMVDADVKRIFNYIHSSTMSAMRDRYTFKGESLTFKFTHHAIILDIFKDQYPDFANWLWLSLNIPLYHSLGDTIGYNNGKWEFNYGNIKANADYVNEMIYDYFNLGGVNDLSIKNWIASDDTIMYLATFDVILSDTPKESFSEALKQKYLKIEPMLKNRHPGSTTINSLDIQKSIAWDKLHYNSKSIGNGAVMRVGCIGIFFVGSINRDKLISYAIENSRLTHNSTLSMLGCVTAALFTAYSMEKVPVHLWLNKLLKIIKSNKIDRYLQTTRFAEYADYVRDKIIYIDQWEKYRELLFEGSNPRLDLKLMKNLVERYRYLAENFSKGCDWPGSCADDCLIMAYDSLLRCNGIFEKLLVFSALHPGDSDTVACVAFSWFYGFYGSPRNDRITHRLKSELEFYDKMNDYFNDNRAITATAKTYFHDLYLHLAYKYLKQYMRNN